MATYATWNPAAIGSQLTLSGGNLTITKTTANAWRSVLSTIGKSSGKWYWEITCTSTAGQGTPGIATSGTNLETAIGLDAFGWSYYGNNGQKFNNGSGAAYGATWDNTHTIGVALDMDAGTLIFLKDNVSQGTAFSGLSGTFYAGMGLHFNGDASTVNFGATALTYSPPSGYNAGLYLEDPPVAAFSGTPLSGTAPLTVAFTDASTNTPTSWSWDFGDGDTSTQQNPSHDYAAGTYTVTLTATNAAGSSAPEVKTDYITVTAAPVASTTRTSGVKKKPPKIRLSTSTKEELGAFLRSQLNLKHAPPEAPPEVEPVVSAQEVEKERKRLAKQQKREEQRALKLKRDAEKFEREREATEIQAAKDNKIQDNNLRLLLMIASV